MLFENFFHIAELQTDGTDIKVVLEINTAHKIFEGHFPGQPVVPGVCMMQMVKEIVEKVTGEKLNLAGAAEMKFLAVIDPEKNNIIHAMLKYVQREQQEISVSATFFKDELTHFKFKGQFVPAQDLSST